MEKIAYLAILQWQLNVDLLEAIDLMNHYSGHDRAHALENHEASPFRP